jgi:hypothetical protein
MKIKNWHEFQHFKDRSPPWIKLYKYILDDPNWHELSGDDSKVLIMLWLIASDDKTMQGNLPDKKTIAFRLRITESKLNQSLTKLSNWLIQDDINTISEVYQLDAPEERRDRGETDNFLSKINPQLLKDYSKIRKAKRAGEFTETALKAMEKEASKCNLTVDQAIAYCCKRAWVGFEASWYFKENPSKEVKPLKVVI